MATRRIDTEARINSIRLDEQASDPSNPASGYASLYVKSDGLYIKQDDGTVLGYTAYATIQFVIDGGGSAITTGQKGHVEIPFDCLIERASIVADQSGDCVVDIWVDTYANFPPADADSITAAAPPTLSTAQKAQDSTLTGWTKTLTQGQWMTFNVDSAATVTRVTVSLLVRKN